MPVISPWHWFVGILQLQREQIMTREEVDATKKSDAISRVAQLPSHPVHLGKKPPSAIIVLNRWNDNRDRMVWKMCYGNWLNCSWEAFTYVIDFTCYHPELIDSLSLFSHRQFWFQFQCKQHHRLRAIRTPLIVWHEE